ncbi:MAG: type VI secretion system baseplate subunit TssG [Planctomycetes bacterium]|nr:type VI secretion system baseplate subunit TssG [Planctomycetota bacterium]
MAAPGRRSLPDLTAELVRDPGAFDFAQAVRVAEDAGAGASGAALHAVGHDEHPSEEAVRFRAAPSLAFAAAPLRSATRRASGALELEVSFLGLTGPSGVLPQHYTELLIERLARRDRALARFLDLLHHRALSLFHRASTKYSLVHSREQAWRWSRDDDPFERVLKCIAGRGLPPRSALNSVVDRGWVYYAAHWGRGTRSAVGLESLLADFLGLEVRVEQFVGRWVEIPPEARTALPTRARPRGQNSTLGAGSVLGRRAWDTSSRIRVELGPMSVERFLELRPDGELLARVRTLIAEYTDGTLDFELALRLAPGERLESRLSVRGKGEARLGWTSQLSARSAQQADTRVLFSLAAP